MSRYFKEHVQALMVNWTFKSLQSKCSISLCGERKDKSKRDESKYIYKGTSLTLGAGAALLDSPREGGVSLITKSSFHKSF